MIAVMVVDVGMASILHPRPPVDLTRAGLTAFVLLDFFLIVALARIAGNLVVKLRQPRVVGEIMAGILLGPTVLGEDLSGLVAPVQARPILEAIATIALIVFMFLLGLEFDRTLVRGRAVRSAMLAVSCVAVPAVVGFPLAAFVHSSPYAADPAGPFLPFALFLGAALSVTAFPVLAHILMERREIATPMGALALTTTALMSPLIFFYLGVASAVASAGGPAGLVSRGVLSIGFVALSVLGVRPVLSAFLRLGRDGSVSGNQLAVVFAGMILWGLVADRLGLSALVGAFLWGLLIPDDRALRRALVARVRDVGVILLLPIFFAVAGLSTDLRLVTSGRLPVLGVFLLAAVGSKFLAVVPARAMGLTWPQTGVLGALFNARGLLLQVVGLVGLEGHIITPTTFTILVLVGLVTTLMVIPLLELLAPGRPAPPRGGGTPHSLGGGRRSSMAG